MATLAIKGHPKRGNEVIEILEMLGGRNLSLLFGDSALYYAINREGIISTHCEEQVIQFSLEEFLEKYPYKVGDKVTVEHYKGVWEIIELLWSKNLNIIHYGISNGKTKELVRVEEIKPYKEEAMEEEILNTFDKELLLKDLCARLPYDVKVSVNQSQLQNYDYKWKNWSFDEEPQEIDGVSIYGVTFGCMDMSDGVIGFEFIKPYLFPLSSMSEEQKKELLTLTGYEARCEESCGFDSWGFYVNVVGKYEYEDNQESITLYPDDIGIDWLNKNHFDYRGLIPMGLAIDATGLNIY